MSLEFRDIHGLKVSKCGVVIGRRGYTLSPAKNTKGYFIVTALVNGVRTTKAVHRLVAEAWVPNPDNLPEVNHCDTIKENCHADNLEWTTRSGNNKHAYETGANKPRRGEESGRCKTTEACVVEICELLQGGTKPSHIRDKGYDAELVQKIKRRKNWTHVSDKYVW